MKRLLMLPLLLLGLSFACDQPHEEVAGYKIGCPFHGDESDMILDPDNKGILIQEMPLIDDFFNSVRIEVLNGNIEGASFSKEYNNDSLKKEDLELLTLAMKNKWGDVEELSENEFFVIKKPSSDVLSHIFIQNEDGRVSIVYSSWNLNDYKLNVWNEKNNEKAKQLEKF